MWYHLNQLLLLALLCGNAERGHCWSVVQSALRRPPAQLLQGVRTPCPDLKEVMKRSETICFYWDEPIIRTEIKIY